MLQIRYSCGLCAASLNVSDYCTAEYKDGVCTMVTASGTKEV